MWESLTETQDDLKKKKKTLRETLGDFDKVLDDHREIHGSLKDDRG